MPTSKRWWIAAGLAWLTPVLAGALLEPPASVAASVAAQTTDATPLRHEPARPAGQGADRTLANASTRSEARLP
ncbi:MAG: hypothetical protein AAF288_11075 [Planctomycetota bacterium]